MTRRAGIGSFQTKGYCIMKMTDEALLTEIQTAVAEFNTSTQIITRELLAAHLQAAEEEDSVPPRKTTISLFAHNEQANVIGRLLRRVKRRHPLAADFFAFVEQVDGLRLDHALDFMKQIRVKR
jgi:hypothetical protein